MAAFAPALSSVASSACSAASTLACAAVTCVLAGVGVRVSARARVRVRARVGVRVSGGDLRGGQHLPTLARFLGSGAHLPLVRKYSV